MTKIIIVAGGLATRMRPITEEIPKCLVDINGKPLIQHQLEFFRDKGYKDIIFCVAHLAQKVKDYFEDGKEFGLNISYVEETEELMGTAGSVKLAKKIIGKDRDFIVYYGDNLTSMDFEKFMDFHRKNKALATICIRPLPEGYKSSSIITLDKSKQIKVFLEKPQVEELEKHKDEKRFINSGIYAFKKDMFKMIPKNQKYDFAKQLFPNLIEKNLGIYGYSTEEFFREIGTVEKYERFLNEFKGRKAILASRDSGKSVSGKTINKKKAKAVFLDRDGVINKQINKLTKPVQFKMIKGVPEAIKKINDNGFLAILITNQPDVSKGFLSFEALELIHEKMKKLLAKKGAHLDSIYICPHHPEKGFDGEIPELKIACSCRKPEPGMLLQAAQEHNIDLSKSYFIGDSKTDILAGQKAGVKTILVTEHGQDYLNKKDDGFKEVNPDFVKKNLKQAIYFLFK